MDMDEHSRARGSLVAAGTTLHRAFELRSARPSSPRPVIGAAALMVACVLLTSPALGMPPPTPREADRSTGASLVEAGSERGRVVIAGWHPQVAPVAQGERVAWSATAKDHPHRFTAHVSSPGRPRIEISRAGKDVFTGGLDGGRLVYDLRGPKDSDIGMFSIVKSRNLSLPQSVNTGRREFGPSISGPHLVFGRLDTKRRISSVVLTDLRSGRQRVLARARGRAFVSPGQVSGNWVVWDSCAARCRVVRYRISTGERQVLPSVAGWAYGASVAADGTVFFVRSDRTCGRDVQIVRYNRAGVMAPLFDVPRGGDLYGTYAYSDDGATKLLYDRMRCSDYQSDIWRHERPAAEIDPGPLTPQARGYQMNLGHNGFAPGTMRTPLLEMWSRRLPGDVSYPVIADGRVFVTVTKQDGGYGATLFALDQRTGRTLWSKRYEGTYFYAHPSYADGKLFVSDFDGRVSAFDPATGETLWSTTSGQGSFGSPPTAGYGLVYVGTGGSGGTLEALDQNTGSGVWTRSVDSSSQGPPPVSDRFVFGVYGCDSVSAFDRNTGAPVWSSEPTCIGGVEWPAVFAANRLYVRRGSPELGRTYEGDTGAVVTHFRSDLAPATGRDGVILVRGRTVTAENPETGERLWSVRPSGGVTTPAVITGGVAFVGVGSGDVVGLSVRTGREVWRNRAGGMITSPNEYGYSRPLGGLAAGEGWLVVPTERGLTGYTSALWPPGDDPRARPPEPDDGGSGPAPLPSTCPLPVPC